uniref:Leucine rich repeat containing 74A n=1 Tax=Leptobrachium leishanense TaxID=445787 RepID=A0A8C5QDX0_9ANUR
MNNASEPKEKKRKFSIYFSFLFLHITWSCSVSLERPNTVLSSDTSLDHVGSIKDLSNVYLQLCHKEGIVPVSYFIRHINDTHVELNHQGLGSKGTYAIAIALMSNTSITQLSLEDNWMMPEGLAHLMDMMRENCYIQDLVTSKYTTNVCGEYEWVAIFLHSHWESIVIQSACYEYILLNGVVNDTLTVLDLSYNGFGNEGALALGEALKANMSLQRLDISCNRISNEGARLLCKGLETNETLRVLKLSRNPLTVEAALLLLISITKNPESKMEELDISVSKIEAKLIQLYPFVLQDYLDERKLRLLDFFKNMDKDGSMSVPVSDFCRHISPNVRNVAEMKLDTEIHHMVTFWGHSAIQRTPNNSVKLPKCPAVRCFHSAGLFRRIQ